MIGEAPDGKPVPKKEIKEEEPCIIFKDIRIATILEEPGFVNRWTTVNSGSTEDKI